jgi:5-methylcytosine-specific restriction endonuclease McrA
MYKGSVSPIYRTSRWQKVRQGALKRDGYECQSCKRFGYSVTATVVHHLDPIHGNPGGKYELSNLTSLCAACHGRMHYQDTRKLSAEGIALKIWLQRDKVSGGSDPRALMCEE